MNGIDLKRCPLIQTSLSFLVSGPVSKHKSCIQLDIDMPATDRDYFNALSLHGNDEHDDFGELPMGPAQQGSPTPRSYDGTLSLMDQNSADFENESIMSMEGHRLYQQLNELEEATQKLQSSCASSRVFSLRADRSLFADVDSDGNNIRADICLSTDVLDSQVLTLSVFCLPSFVLEEDFANNVQKLRIPGVDFVPLQFRFFYRGSEPPSDDYDTLTGHRADALCSSTVTSDLDCGAGVEIAVKAILYNDEYLITLTNAGFALRQGYYSLFISAEEDSNDPLFTQRDDSSVQTVRLSYQLQSQVQATALSPNNPIRDCIAPDERKYYRFVLTDSRKFLRFSLRKSSVQSADTFSGHSVVESNTPFDVDLWVTNRCQGLVAVDRKNAVWSSCDCSPSNIDILPSDSRLCATAQILKQQLKQENRRRDMSSSRAMDISQEASALLSMSSDLDIDTHIQTFLICVSGNHNDLSDSNRYEFELEVHIANFLPSMHTHLIDAAEDKRPSAMIYSSLLLPHLETRKLDFHALEISPYQGSRVCVAVRLFPQVHKQWASIDAFLRQTNSHAQRVQYDRVLCSQWSPFQNVDVLKALEEEQQFTWKNRHNLEALKNRQPKQFYVTVLYLSHRSLYPGPASYMCKASGGAEAIFELNSSDWKYLSNAVYFSLYVCKVSADELLRMLTESTLPSADRGDVIDQLVETHGLRVSSGGGDALGIQQSALLSQTSHAAEGSAVDESLSTARCYVLREDVANSAAGVSTTQGRLFEKIFADIDGAKLTFRDRNGMDFSSQPFQPLFPAFHQRTSQWAAFTLADSTLNQSLDHSAVQNMSSLVLTGVPSSVTPLVDDTSLSCSEVEFASFAQFLRTVPAVDGEVFYDLGCGVGKAVVAAALSGICFLKASGLEVLPSLAQCCSDVLQSLSKEAQSLSNSISQHAPPQGHQNHHSHSHNRSQLPKLKDDNLVSWLTSDKELHGSDDEADDNASINSYLTQTSCSYQVASLPELAATLRQAKIKLPILECRNVNFLETDLWLEADIIFASSLCFSDAQMDALTRKASGLRKGSRLVTSKLGNGYAKWFDLKSSAVISLTCGDVLFHILQRK